MTAGEIPDRVWRFIAERIDSVPQLEALLLMWRDRDRCWAAQEVATALHVVPSAAAATLAVLAERGLLRTHAEGFQYTSDWDAGGLMAEVAEAYRHHLIPIATYIHSRQS